MHYGEPSKISLPPMTYTRANCAAHAARLLLSACFYISLERGVLLISASMTASLDTAYTRMEETANRVIDNVIVFSFVRLLLSV